MAFVIVEEDKNLKISVSGEFDASVSKEIQKDLEKYTTSSFNKIEFDLAETVHMASSGLRVVIFAEERLNSNGNVVISNSKGLVRQIIRMSGIDSFVKVI